MLKHCKPFLKHRSCASFIFIQKEGEKEEPKVLVMARKLFKASLVNNPFFLLFSEEILMFNVVV